MAMEYDPEDSQYRRDTVRLQPQGCGDSVIVSWDVAKRIHMVNTMVEGIRLSFTRDRAPK